MHKIITLSSIILASVLVGCEKTYPSKQQAQDACYEWAAKGTKAEGSVPNKNYYEGSYSNKIISYTYPSRICPVEEETNQVLGKLNRVVEDKKFDYYENKGEYKVVKTFRY